MPDLFRMCAGLIFVSKFFYLLFTYHLKLYETNDIIETTKEINKNILRREYLRTQLLPSSSGLGHRPLNATGCRQ